MVKEKTTGVQDKTNKLVENVYNNGGYIIVNGYIPEAIQQSFTAREYFAMSKLLKDNKDKTNNEFGSAIIFLESDKKQRYMSVVNFSTNEANISNDNERLANFIQTSENKGDTFTPHDTQTTKDELNKVADAMTGVHSHYSADAVDSLMFAGNFLIDKNEEFDNIK